MVQETRALREALQYKFYIDTFKRNNNLPRGVDKQVVSLLQDVK